MDEAYFENETDVMRQRMSAHLKKYAYFGFIGISYLELYKLLDGGLPSYLVSSLSWLNAASSLA